MKFAKQFLAVVCLVLCLTAAAGAADRNKNSGTGQYRTVKYRDVARNPERYKEKDVTFSGKVVQVVEDGLDATLRIAQDKPGESYSSDMWLAGYKRQKGESRILEDDRIRVYGKCRGSITYQSTLGGAITVPAIRIDSYELLD
ncbi:MAG: hypothetical protein IJ702_06975 [Fretibacterium sp.]|nr:hypothetical protein [Fretibacterium sp.]